MPFVLGRLCMQIGVLFLRVLGLRGWVGGKKKRRREEN